MKQKTFKYDMTLKESVDKYGFQGTGDLLGITKSGVRKMWLLQRQIFLKKSRNKWYFVELKDSRK